MKLFIGQLVFILAIGLGSIKAENNNKWILQTLRLIKQDSSRQSGLIEEGQLGSVCASNPCLNDGVCSPAGDSFSCKCPWGWTGIRCEVCLTECASNPCPSNKRCKAIFGGGFECVCPPNSSGPECDIQLDSCPPNQCLNQGVCKPLLNGQFSCECAKPWSGERCERLFENPCTHEALRSVEIQQFPNPWDRSSYLICLDVNEYHAMSCSTGTVFNQKLNHCVPEGFEAPVCPSQFCHNDGECVLSEIIGEPKFRCMCKKGFSGDRCQTNIDECTTEGNFACTGGTCVDQVNGYYCMCQNGMIGLNCRETIQNPCHGESINGQFFEIPGQMNNVYLQCRADGQFTVNKCADNLFWNQNEHTCSIEKPLARNSLCGSSQCINGECMNDVCVCAHGYEGSSCDRLIDFCISNPCKNNGRCLTFPGGYNCICQDKIVDECCCNGVINPCPQRMINGRTTVPDTLFPHLFPNRFIQCDHEGRGFVKSCPAKMRWNQELLTCVPNVKKSSVISRPSQQPVQAYGTQTFPAPLQTTSYTVPEQNLPQQVAQLPTFQIPTQPIHQQPQYYSPAQAYSVPEQQQQIQQAPVEAVQQQQPQPQQQQMQITPEFLTQLINAGLKIPDNLLKQLLSGSHK